MRYEREKVCIICGKRYIAYTPNSRYCSDECKEEGNRIIKEMYNDRRVKCYHAKKKKSNDALIDISAEAKKLGMSYGQYVALNGL